MLFKCNNQTPFFKRLIITITLIHTKTLKGESYISKTIEMLKKYLPYNEQEKEDINLIVKAEEIFGNIITRENKV